jgi:hypothetical protein
MEYVIVVAVVSIMALYALIIVGLLETARMVTPRVQ